MGLPSPQPFRMHVADETLRDLRERLMRVRWPDEPPGAPWLTGSSVDYLRELVGYWRDGFDWRAQETALNRFQQFKVPLGGIDLHFIHEEGKGPNPMPLLLSTAGQGRSVLRSVTGDLGFPRAEMSEFIRDNPNRRLSHAGVAIGDFALDP